MCLGGIKKFYFLPCCFRVCSVGVCWSPQLCINSLSGKNVCLFLIKSVICVLWKVGNCHPFTSSWEPSSILGPWVLSGLERTCPNNSECLFSISKHRWGSQSFIKQSPTAWVTGQVFLSLFLSFCCCCRSKAKQAILIFNEIFWISAVIVLLFVWRCHPLKFLLDFFVWEAQHRFHKLVDLILELVILPVVWVYL